MRPFSLSTKGVKADFRNFPTGKDAHVQIIREGDGIDGPDLYSLSEDELERVINLPLYSFLSCIDCSDANTENFGAKNALLTYVQTWKMGDKSASSISALREISRASIAARARVRAVNMKYELTNIGDGSFKLVVEVNGLECVLQEK